ncbi:MAG TPA: chemotaxis protein CheW [Roseomonas sp.]|jgi:two-component system chemotaxis sensor kinase CheA
MDDLLADFLTETNEGITALDGALLRLEKVPDDMPTLAEVFRLVHTIKGTCGFLGLGRLEKVAHAAENVLGGYRDGSLRVSQGGISLILRAMDAIRAIIRGLEATGAEPAGDDAAIIAALDAAYAGELPETPAAGPAAAPAAAMLPEVAAVEAVESGPASGPQTIRVAVDVLEGLMTLVSELVLTRNQLLQLTRASGDPALAVPLQRLSHITSELQEGVMKTRMQPIGNAWAKLPRLVRDLALELGKKIDLDMRGAETELDRQVLELIKDPLTHMVRNSGDHGLETPEQRRAAGKPETGRVTLNAYHQGGHIIIEVGDDGRGLAVDRIRAKALANGLASEAELAQMNDHEIQRFIFNAGFSTAQQITAVSGRGVGMDVVKTNIEKIGGTIELRSREGHGTTFTIKIPLTLAIVSALIVEAGGERFAVPQIGVVELVRAGAGGPRVERIKDSLVMRLRDRLLPLVPLAHLLRLTPEAGDLAEAFVIVTQVGPNVFGIVVDRVFDTEEIVVKPVAPILRHVTAFSGNTILGDGSVIMILDPNGIARAAGVGAGAEGSETEVAREEAVAGVADAAANTALLLFRGGDAGPKAVPLGLIARLEHIPFERIETSGGTQVVQYRGKLMPLIPVGGAWSPPADDPAARQPVLVFSDGEQAMGLMVDEILDVVEQRLDIQMGSDQPGFLGSAVIAGKVTEVIDTAHWLRRAGGDWFGGRARATGNAPRILLVEDSPFFRNMVVPALSAAGYAVTAAEGAAQALRLRDQGIGFDAVVTDIEMPGLSGYDFAHAVRQEGPWRDMPLIALTARGDPDDIARGHEAGFTDYVVKFERDALLASLRDCVGRAAVAA